MIFINIICCFSTILLTSCGRSEKSTYYFHGKEAINIDVDTVIIVDPYSDESVLNHIVSTEFRSKNSTLIVDDSLNVLMKKDGVIQRTGKFILKPYMVREDRIVIMMDTLANKEYRFTVSANGDVTDLDSYIIYKSED